MSHGSHFSVKHFPNISSFRACSQSQSIRIDTIVCTTQVFANASNTPGPPVTGSVVVYIDNAIISNSSVNFTYTLNPEFKNITPSNTIPAYDCILITTATKCYVLQLCMFCINFDSGGIEITFSGTNLDVVQDPVMLVNDSDYVDAFNVSRCDASSISLLVIILMIPRSPVAQFIILPL